MGQCNHKGICKEDTVELEIAEDVMMEARG